MTVKKSVDITVIGAGIAGASVAAELSRHASVLLLEKENYPGYHSTGRSAAMYIPSYGPAPIQSLTKASGDFFHDPPTGFCEAPLLQPRAEMLIAREDQLQAIDRFLSQSSGDSIKRLDAQQLRQLCPLLKPDYAVAAVLDESGSDIDVHSLHQGFLALFKQNGGELLTNCSVQGLTRTSNHWSIHTNTSQFQSNIIVNAAGAWADEVGQMADAEHIGLVPKRRTAMTIELPGNLDVASMPLVADIDEAFYIKPDAGNLLISPANEDPVAPCDVQPEELDVAICVDQIETAFDLNVTSIVRKWAGLRSFVKDNSPVAGFSAQAENFFWLAGQGGYGIQSSPALSRYAAALILKEQIPDDLRQQGLSRESLSVDRLEPAR